MPDLVFPNAVPNFLPQVVAGQQAGLQRKRLNALSLASSDPDAATSALVAAGDLQGATELANMRYVQSQRQLMQNALGELQGAPAPAQAPSGAPAIPTAPTSSAPPTTPTAPNTSPAPSAPSADQADAAMQKLDQLDGIRTKLQSLPYEQRKPALQAAAPDLAQIGFGGDQLAQFDPTDQNLAKIADQSQQLRLQVAQQGRVDQAQPDPNAPQPPQAAPQQPQGAAPAPAAPQAAPAQPAPTGGAPGAGLDLTDPRTQKALELLTLANPPMAQAMIALGTSVMPSYDVTRGGLQYEKHHPGFVAAAPVDGIQTELANGQVVGAHNVPGYAKATAEQEAAREGAKAAVEYSYAGPKARAVAAGTGAGEAPFQVVTVNMPPDAGHPGGYTAQMTLDQFKSLNGRSLPGGGRVGQAGGPAAEQFGKEDASEFAKTVSTVGSPEAIMHEQNSRDIVLQTLHTVQGLDPNAFTANKFQAMSLLKASGLAPANAKEFVNNVATYQALMPQVLRGTFSTFPRLEKEFEVVKAGMANISTPKDAASTLFATQAAIHDRNLAFANFASNWSGPPSEQAMNRAFNASPAGQRSIFADQVFQNLQIDGKPATYVNPQPHNGHVYGVFRPGTPYAQTFLVN